jgi:lipid-binding SYLF domain-containing protein
MALYTRGSVVAVLALALVVPGVRAHGVDLATERERVDQAAQVLRELTRAEDAQIPAALLRRAKALAVVPHVVRGAFIVGGRWGKGLLTTRDADGHWGPTSFVDLSGASVGFQIGGDATDLVMVFIEEDGLAALLEDRVELGGNASVAVGPLGRSAELATNLTLDSAIYAYSRTKGLFAGAALDGTVVTIDDSANAKVFGRAVTGTDVMAGRVPPEAIFSPFVEAVRAIVPSPAR